MLIHFADDPDMENGLIDSAIVWAKRAGFRLVEGPNTGHRPRLAGSSTGANLHVILRAFQELIQVRRQLWREGKGARSKRDGRLDKIAGLPRRIEQNRAGDGGI